MPLSLQQLRSGIATQILGITGFTLSKHLPDYFGRQQNTIAHRSFAVSIGLVSASPERQRRPSFVYVETSVLVSFAYRLRPLDAYPTDYDLALDAERQVIEKVLGSYASIQNEIQIRFVSSSREATESNEYMIHSLEFIARHTL